jgi:hypothetical protein
MSVVYTLSDRGNMAKQIVKSLKSLSSFVEKRDITIFLTPPRKKSTARELSKYGNVIEAPDITKPFVFSPARGLGYYGEKVHLCEIESPEVIFLDCDTVVKKNIYDLLEGDYDFSARLGDNTSLNWDVWKEYCSKHGKTPNPFFNAGFMIFKNGLHHKIQQEWLKFINEDIPKIHPQTYTKEQYALVLALDGYKIKHMDKSQHAFAWKDETEVDTYVLHGYRRSLKRRIMGKLRQKLQQG